MIFTLVVVKYPNGWLWRFDLNDNDASGILKPWNVFQTEKEALTDARKWARRNGVRYKKEKAR